jgi:hypothetical protein
MRRRGASDDSGPAAVIAVWKVGGADPLVCRRCGGKLRIIAYMPRSRESRAIARDPRGWLHLGQSAADTAGDAGSCPHPRPGQDPPAARRNSPCAWDGVVMAM